jgi:hypothetical protein
VAAVFGCGGRVEVHAVHRVGSRHLACRGVTGGGAVVGCGAVIVSGSGLHLRLDGDRRCGRQRRRASAAQPVGVADN